MVNGYAPAWCWDLFPRLQSCRCRAFYPDHLQDFIADRLSPPPYDGLMMAALVRFLVQTVFSGFFYFVETIVATPGQSGLRIVLLDGPLRDM